MVTLVTGDSGLRGLFLVLEVNCISNLSPNHTLQLTTLTTSVNDSLHGYVVYYLIEFKELAGLACIETQNII